MKELKPLLFAFGGALLILLIIEIPTFAQDEAEKVYRYVEQMPEYPGGIIEFQKFIAENLVFPKEGKRKRNFRKSLCFIYD